MSDTKDRSEKFHLGDIVTDGNIIGIFSYYDMDFFWGGRDDFAMKGHYNKQEDNVCQTEIAGYNVFEYDFASDEDRELLFNKLKENNLAINPYTLMIESTELVQEEKKKPHSFEEAVEKYIRDNVRLDFDGQFVKLMIKDDVVSEVRIHF